MQCSMIMVFTPISTPMHTILFICTGNTCRSPMAEGIARHLLGDRSRAVFVASAGIAASEGAPISPETRQALQNHGIDFDGHSNPLGPEMIRKATLVYCMTESHVKAARAMVEGDAASQEKIKALDPENDLKDPIGLGQSAYDALADHLLELLPRRLEEFLKEDPS